MDIGFLEKADHMKPLLVKLYDAHGTYRCYEDNSAKLKLSNVVSDLLDVSVSEREKDLVSDILLALLQQAEVELRRAISKRVASMDNAPSRVILNLAYDEIDVAEHVLRESPVLEALDLMYIIQSKTPAHCRAVAARPDLPDAIMEELSTMGDIPIYEVLASNEFINLTSFTVENLFESACKEDSIASALIGRSDVPRALIKKLYNVVGRNIKAQIEDVYDDICLPLQNVVSDAVDELVFEDSVSPYMPPPSMMSSEQARLQVRTERQSQIKSVLLQEMLSELRLRNYRLFVAKFSIFMGVAPEDAINILEQQYGQGLAILVRSHGVDRSEFIKIYLLTDVLRGQKGVMQGSTLNRALAYYDRLSVDLARTLYTRNFKTSV